MACMRHVNVVQFVGACTKPPQLAIVTEYLPKMSLYDVMRTEALLWPRMLRIGSQVCVCACVRACVLARAWLGVCVGVRHGVENTRRTTCCVGIRRGETRG